jgi:TonB family protein
MQYPLPAFPEPRSESELRVDLNILVGEDGTVRYVEILRGSGNPAWDSAAESTIKMWRYSPARYKNTPMKLWLHQTAVIQFSHPNYLTIAELLCPTKVEADSVFRKLNEGCDFCEMVLLYSIAPTREQKGMVGTVNIQNYPEHIRKVLSSLDSNQWTEPVPYGEWFAIFKRVE